MCVSTNRNISIAVTTVLWQGYSIIIHSNSITLIFHAPKQTDKIKHARLPPPQLIPVERPVYTQSPTLSHPPQRPRKCLAEILESYSRSRYALLFIYTYLERLSRKNLALRIGENFFPWPLAKKKKKKRM